MANKTVYVRVADELTWDLAQAIAADRNLSLSEVATEGLKLWLAENKPGLSTLVASAVDRAVQ